MSTFNKERFTVTFNNVFVHAKVSPCSWMNENYGMQVQLSLKANAYNIGSHFINKKDLLAKDATQDDVEKNGE